MPNLESKQSGSTTIGANDTNVTVNINAVDTSKSIILVTGRGNHYDLSSGLFYPQFNSSTQIQISRVNIDLTNSINLEYQVLEFADDVTVATYTISTDGSDVYNETITEVDRTKTFVITYYGSAGGSTDQAEGYCRASLTSDTNLRIIFGSGAGPSGGTVKAQVVTMARCNVHEISDSFSGNSNDSTISSVDTSNTLVLGGISVDSTFENQELPNFYLVDSTTLRAVKYGTSYTIDYTVFVIESPDFDVQTGDVAIASDGTTNTDIINSVNTDNSFLTVSGSYQCLAYNEVSTAEQSFAYCMFTGVFNSSTEVEFQRNYFSYAATVYYQVVEVKFRGENINAIWM